MIKIIKLLVINTFSRFKRKVYWLYRLSHSQLGNGSKIDFPVIREGKGKLKLGKHSFLGKYSEIGIGEQAHLCCGKHALIETKGTILIDKTCSLTIGDDFKLGRNSRLFVKGNWTFGNHITIETNCAVFAREPNAKGVLSIGDNTNIGDFTILDVFDDITIGNDVAIGPNCTIYTHDHIYTNKEVAAWKGGIVTKPVHIKNGAWIGSNVTLLPGVTIGERAVVAAGSIVTKSVEANSIYGGNPAKLIKNID
ncbi:DapH/DapD/GlmU-related protein [uncultured Psychroserpens sp.]|uniref:acyltransferase n=1 Tax=uncultured Psychroserpens sp. TaxID=255436 RepID=UPI0026373570|nr:acyltransferase [uncultured Psychroserpens sp.]